MLRDVDEGLGRIPDQRLDLHRHVAARLAHRALRHLPGLGQVLALDVGECVRQ
jgi:hypothetical protein